MINRKLGVFAAVAAFLLAASAPACWFADGSISFDDNHISYLTGDVKHVTKTEDGKWTITNDQKVALPFTLYIKVSPHKRGGDTGNGDGQQIKKAVLQYRILGKTGAAKAAPAAAENPWVTVKEIDNPSWDMDFENPVALFGRDCVDIPGLTEETEIVVRLYLSDGVYETGPLESKSEEGSESETDPYGSIQQSITVNGTTAEHDGFKLSEGWTAPFVWKLKVMPTKAAEKTKPSRRPSRGR